jgi:hypothetical protein
MERASLGVGWPAQAALNRAASKRGLSRCSAQISALMTGAVSATSETSSSALAKAQ